MFKLMICVLLSLSYVSAKNFVIIEKYEIESDEENEVYGKMRGPTPPPDYKDYARMTRWLVHNNGDKSKNFFSFNEIFSLQNIILILDWTAMGTLSTSPQVCSFSVSNNII